MRRFQPGDGSYVATAGVQIGQAEQVLIGQWSERFLQGRADGGVQAGIGNGNFLRERRRHEAGKNHRSDQVTDSSSALIHMSWKPERGLSSMKGVGRKPQLFSGTIDEPVAPIGIEWTQNEKTDLDATLTGNTRTP